VSLKQYSIKAHKNNQGVHLAFPSNATHWECTHHRRRVAPLDRQAQPLLEKRVGSGVPALSRKPAADIRKKAQGPKASRVSTAAGMKVKPPAAASSSYLVRLLHSAFSVSDPAVKDEDWK